MPDTNEKNYRAFGLSPQKNDYDTRPSGKICAVDPLDDLSWRSAFFLRRIALFARPGNGTAHRSGLAGDRSRRGIQGAGGSGATKKRRNVRERGEGNVA